MSKESLVKMGFWLGVGWESANQIVYMVSDWIKIFLDFPLG